MDAEGFLADEQYQQMCKLRDSIKEQAQRYSRDLRARLSALEKGNRKLRRRAGPARIRIEAFENWFNSRIDQEFDKLLNGYRPEIGMFQTVQQEAASKLAAIFS